MENKYRTRYFFEYGGGCLWSDNENDWDKYGNPINPERLPLSKETLTLIEKLEEQFQTSLNWDEPNGKSPWTDREWSQFNEQALVLFNCIKYELRDDFELINKQND